MIYLLTGVPGSGKTALLVSILMGIAADKVNPRPIYQHSVRGLKVPHTPIFCRDRDCEFCGGGLRDGRAVGDDVLFIDEFKKWAPPNAVIVLDEVQRQYRVRGRAAQVPQFVQDLETNRHGGVDLYMVTQSPQLIDLNIRKLVNVHHHLEPHLLGIRKRTFMGCQSSPEKAKGGEESTYKPDKKTFDQYVSAELHTKIVKPIPKAVYLLGFAVVLAVGGGYAAVGKVRSLFRLTDDVPEVVDGSASDVVQEAAADLGGSPEHAQELLAAAQAARFDFSPVVDGVLESASIYAGMASPRDFPRRAACVKAGARCRCYTQQATDYPTTKQQCEAFIEGRVSSFNPYAPPAPFALAR